MIGVIFGYGVFARSDSPNILNLGPEFKVYVDQNRGSEWDTRWSNWKVFETKYSSYFSEGLCASQSDGCEEKKKLRLREFFMALPRLEPKLWNYFQSSAEAIEVQRRAFKKEFVDFKDDTLVVLMPSLLGFNGRVATIGERHVLLIAPDSLLDRADNLDVVFSHELFHVYQFDRIGKGEIFRTMASPLWFEGFATWMSIFLNPGTGDAPALMDDALAAYCSSPDHVSFLAKEYLSILSMKSDSPTVDTVYQRWFLLSSNTVPTRRGYCLGLQVMRQLTHSQDFKPLVALDESQFTPLVLSALENLAKGK